MKKLSFITLSVGLLLFSSALSAKVIPSDGHWRTYDDPAIGSGINIRTQGDITMVIVFTYREDGSPVWYYATGEIDDNGVFDVPLMETKNGENIFNNSPQTAEVFDPEKRIRLNFNATETGTLSINDSEPKPIHTYRFDIDGIETEQLTTPLGDFYQFPDITGQWAMGSANDNISFNFDFVTNYGALADPPSPNFHFHFTDELREPEGIFYFLSCPTRRATEAPYCRFYVNQNDVETNERAAVLNRLYVFLDDIGMNTMTFHLQPEGDETYSREHPTYQAFRLNTGFDEPNDIDTRLFPNEGHWRTLDDPEIGSGINFHSQGDVVMMTVFTYNEAGEPIWYMATGELTSESIPDNDFNANSWANLEMFTTKGGTPIDSVEPVSADLDQFYDVTLLLSAQQMAHLNINGGAFKEIKSYQFGFPEFIANHYYPETGDPLKFASPEGWWLMAEENGSESALVHLVKDTSKLTPPPPTDWTEFINVAASSSWISGMRCPENAAYIWMRCQVYMTDFDNSISTYLSLTNIGVDTMRIYYRDGNRPDIGDYPSHYFYYNFYRINPPLQP
ncbi:hypothetical protein [Marinicella gelatinilytica]|uniref:hypothetical protein n=1 Tax=Marinicella gelatinilytica TaxID=2996017 RepID=UPI002260B8AF|nr:hypothetical protein [Marinicella gelatinilytica]MCX7544817.1 hypothetical protein [Marinicella gelatinilytica]